eukprot:gene1619-16078_t
MPMVRTSLNDCSSRISNGLVGSGFKENISLGEDAFKRFSEFEDSDLSDFPSNPASETSGSPASLSTEPNNHNAVQLFQQAVPSHLLIVALLEHICTLYDNQHDKSDELFQILCQQLSTMKLIPAFAIHDEFKLIRSKYRSALNDLMQFAVATTQKQRETEVVERPLSWYLSESSVKSKRQGGNSVIHTPSRYREEFEEIDQLGEGGFGSVFEAVNKLDGKRYAVKKVVLDQLNPVECLKTLREAKVLANLDHPNIVRYHVAWLEYAIAEKKKRSQGHLEDLEVSQESLGSSQYLRPPDDLSEASLFCYDGESTALEKSDSLIFFESGGETKSNSDQMHFGTKADSYGFSGVQVNVREEIRTTDFGLLQKGHLSNTFCKIKDTITSKTAFHCRKRMLTANPDFRASDKSDNLAVVRRLSPQTSGFQDDLSTIAIVMHIQMELCSITLKHWLTDRNETISDHGGQVDWSNNLRIFEQILHGIDYIHRQSLMHRDLKPCNVFLNQRDCSGDIGVKIGDFGLARDAVFNPMDRERRNALIELFDSDNGQLATKGVGTITYAAPEQLETNTYTKKADIYSLGIILFELFMPFKTAMERHELFRGLRKGDLPCQIMERWPQVGDLILKMTEPSPWKRPDARAILKMPLFQDKDNIISFLRFDLQERDKEIERLKRALRDMELKASGAKRP